MKKIHKSWKKKNNSNIIHLDHHDNIFERFLQSVFIPETLLLFFSTYYSFTSLPWFVIYSAICSSGLPSLGILNTFLPLKRRYSKDILKVSNCILFLILTEGIFLSVHCRFFVKQCFFAGTSPFLTNVHKLLKDRSAFMFFACFFKPWILTKDM